MKLSALLEEIRTIAGEGNSLVKGDALIDIVKIVEDVEEIEEFDIEDEFKTCKWFWCLRLNGTNLVTYKVEADEWLSSYEREAVAIYEISYKNRKFSMNLYKKVTLGFDY